MKKLGLLVALALCLPTITDADSPNYVALSIKYNLNSTSVIYCKTRPIGTVPIKIKTTGSSQSVTENTASTNPFTDLAQDDIIQVTKPDGTALTASIKTRTDAANVVVDTAIDLSAGYVFNWIKQTCGTTAEDGWADVGSFADKTVFIEYNQGDLTGGLDVQVQCRGGYPGAQATQVWPSFTAGVGNTFQNFPTAGVGLAGRFTVPMTTPCSQIRVGIKANTGDPSDATTNAEIITVALALTPRR